MRKVVILRLCRSDGVLTFRMIDGNLQPMVIMKVASSE